MVVYLSSDFDSVDRFDGVFSFLINSVGHCVSQRIGQVQGVRVLLLSSFSSEKVTFSIRRAVRVVMVSSER